jgi:hypothetical protein
MTKLVGLMSFSFLFNSAMLIPEFQENLDIDLIDSTVMKYIKATPNNEADEKVYICVLKFLGRQIDAGELRF